MAGTESAPIQYGAAMFLSELYQWEVEIFDLLTGEERTIRQYNDDGTENPSTMIPVDEVVRASILSRNGGPRHDILIDHRKGERFIKRFGRGIMKQRNGKIVLAEYLHCIQTTYYRLWIFSTTGQGLVTNPEFEVYL